MRNFEKFILKLI